jgi:hypothetical protein
VEFHVKKACFGHAIRTKAISKEESLQISQGVCATHQDFFGLQIASQFKLPHDSDYMKRPCARA